MRAGRILATALSLGAIWLAGVACPPPPCSYNDSALAPDEPGILSIQDGDGETGRPGESITLRVQLTDHDGVRVCAGTISWTPAANSGTVAASESDTDQDGVAEANWTLGPTLGTQLVTATLDRANPPLTVTFSATVTVAVLEIVSGDGQSATGGTGLAEPLRVRLVDETGDPGPATTTLTWEVDGGGTLEGTTTTTDPVNGSSENTWTLGPAGQEQTVTVSEPGGSLVTFTATATSPAGSHPKARISAYNGTLTPGVTVTMQTPYDGPKTFGPLAPSTQAADSLQVEVGVAFQITATVGAQSGSITCTTLPAIIPNLSDPVNTGNAQVAVFLLEGGGVSLNCNVAWASVAAGARSTGPRVPRGTARSVVP